MNNAFLLSIRTVARPVARPVALAIALAFSGAALAQLAPGTLPTGANVVSGTVGITNPAADLMRITNTPGAIVNWQSFSIGSAARVTIDQANSASAILNRVTGVDPSQIMGRLDSNGRVFLINPNGVLFGAGSVVDVQSLIASTRNISDINFLNGNYLFEGSSTAPITVANGALITTANRGSNGQVWLFASQVKLEQGSQINAPDGQVVLAAGSQLQVGTSELGNMTFSVSTGSENTIDSYGTIAAQRGAVGMFADSIVQGGQLATSEAVLMAARDITVKDDGTVNADGEAGQAGGRVLLNAGNRLQIDARASVSADGSAEGGNGGRIDLVAYEVQVSPVASGMGNVHASGRASGAQNGEVRVMPRATPLQAQPATGQFIVSLSATKDMYPDVTYLADGSFVVTWMGLDLPTNVLWDVQYATVYAQRFTASGQPIGGRIQLGSVTGNQSFPSITAGRDGGFIAAWADGRTGRREVWGRRFDASGLPVGGDLKLSSDLGDQDNVKLSTLSDGRFLVTWSSRSSLSPLAIDVRGQLLDQNGAPAGTTFTINATGTADRGYQYRPEIAPLADGGFLVTYHASAPNAYNADAYGRRFDRSGQPVGLEFVIASTAKDDWRIATRGLTDGGFVVVWDTVDSSGANRIYLRRYDANGILVQTDTPVGAAPGGTGQSHAQVASMADGGYVVAWMSYQNGAGNSNADVYEQRFAANGTPVSAPRLVAGGVSAQWEPRVASTADNGYALTWYSNENGGLDIMAQRFATPAQEASVAGGVSGELSNRGYATAAGNINGQYMPPPVVMVPPPVEPTPMPTPMPTPRPTSDLDMDMVTPPPFESAPVLTPLRVNTESVHNEVRRVTPTGLSDFTLPGSSPVFTNSSVDVKPGDMSMSGGLGGGITATPGNIPGTDISAGASSVVPANAAPAATAMNAPAGTNATTGNAPADTAAQQQENGNSPSNERRRDK